MQSSTSMHLHMISVPRPVSERTAFLLRLTRQWSALDNGQRTTDSGHGQREVPARTDLTWSGHARQSNRSPRRAARARFGPQHSSVPAVVQTADKRNAHVCTRNRRAVKHSKRSLMSHVSCTTRRSRRSRRSTARPCGHGPDRGAARALVVYRCLRQGTVYLFDSLLTFPVVRFSSHVCARMFVQNKSR